jgi:hypothetical protein
MTDQSTIKIFSSKHCGPCAKVHEKIEQGKVNAPGPVEIVDVESDEGFKRFSEEVLSKGDGFVPAAFSPAGQCEIGYDEEDNLVIECP